MSSVRGHEEEYEEYGYGPPHLDEKKVLDRFAAEKARHPNALVTLNDLDCGHWTVKVYESPVEKAELINHQISTIFKLFLAALSGVNKK